MVRYFVFFSLPCSIVKIRCTRKEIIPRVYNATREKKAAKIYVYIGYSRCSFIMQCHSCVGAHTHTVYIVAIVNAYSTCKLCIRAKFVYNLLIRVSFTTRAYFVPWTRRTDVFERAAGRRIYTLQYCADFSSTRAHCARGGCVRQVCLAPYGPGEYAVPRPLLHVHERTKLFMYIIYVLRFIITCSILCADARSA